MNNLAVLPLLTPKREPLRSINTNDLKSPLARALRDVPALARHMDRSSHNALSATDRSCYHAISRHELWRDRWEPLFREFRIGPNPATPAWLSHRDVMLSFYAVGTKARHVQPRLTGREIDIAWDNQASAKGAKTLADLFPGEAYEYAVADHIAEARAQTCAVLRRARKAMLFPLLCFYGLLAWAFSRTTVPRRRK